MDDKQKEKDKVFKMIRGCLDSFKGQMTIFDLDKDYRCLAGERIPYGKFGFPNLEKFLCSFPEVSLRPSNNGFIINLKPSEATKHIVNMVKAQKGTSKKSSQQPPRRQASSWKSFPRRPLRSNMNTTRPLFREINNNDKLRVPPKYGMNQNRQEIKPFDFKKISGTNQNFKFSFIHQQSSPNLPSSSTLNNTQKRNLSKKDDIISSSIVPGSAAQQKNENMQKTQIQYHKSSSTSMMMDNKLHQEPLKQQIQIRVQNTSIPPSIRPPLYSRSLMAFQNIYGGNKASPQRTVLINTNTPKNKPKNSRSSPPHQTIQSDQPSAPKNQRFIELLKKFTKDNNLPEPTYKVITHKPKKQPAFFCATVHIGAKQFVSMPDGGKSGLEAQDIVAKKALAQLQEQMPNCQLPETNPDINLLSKRIYELVSSHSNGFWSTEIPLSYQQKYQESLPKNWFSLVQSSPLLKLEMIANNEKYIISAREPDDIPVDFDNIEFKSEPLIVPTSQAWDIFVTCADSTEEVWLRLIGSEYSDEFNNMSTDMEMYYMNPKSKKSNNLYIGGLYALYQDGIWHRVRLTELLNDESNHCTVFFIDHGDEEKSIIDDLYPLEPRFTRLPPQAIPCHLSGLEEFRFESCVPSILVEHIIGRSLVAEVVSRPNQELNEDVTIGLILYDTTTEDDINLNDIITDEIIKHLNEPQLEEDNIQEVFLSHISHDGVIYLKCRSDIQNYLERLLNHFGDDPDTLFANTIQGVLPLNISEQPIYLLLPNREMENIYKRCKIIDFNEEKVKIFLIDEGPILTVPAHQVLSLDQFNSPLSKIPKQIIASSLNQITNFDESVIGRIRELCPVNEPILARCVARNKISNLPLIELFKRIEPDKVLVSINADIANFKAIETMNGGGGAIDKAIERKQRIQRLSSLSTINNIENPNNINSPTSPLTINNPLILATSKRYGLSIPEMPSRGNLIDVHVSIVASPSNFIVQPLCYRPKLGNLVSEMNNTYEKLSFNNTEPIQEGKVYAVKNSDIWYRAYVNTILNSTASVYFCDFGDVAILPTNNFRPLFPEFKELPFQAIKSCLAGVEPKHKDWSVVDCLAFKEIVYEKEFVAKVVDILPSSLNKDEAIFSLELIDTSGNADIYIHKKLIEQERARPVRTSAASV